VWTCYRLGMKTTIELPGELVEEAQRVAEREGVPLARLLEDALRAALTQRGEGKKPFKLRDARAKTGGLRPEFEGNWPAIRDEIYRGRGT
jgi:hypothetical protein